MLAPCVQRHKDDDFKAGVRLVLDESTGAGVSRDFDLTEAGRASPVKGTS